MNEISAKPRNMLKKLRTLMAKPMEAQIRLDQIVGDIADNMAAEVCSIYLLRSDNVLELFATKGLDPRSVHRAQLRLGHGLVGTIAATSRPLNLVDAQLHEAFTYLPETGEEIYSSFLGVPILRAGRTLGVLVVQSVNQRSYSEDEVESLETVAMVLAEMIVSRNFLKVSQSNVGIDIRRPFTLSGACLNGGIGLGFVVLHEPRVVVKNLFNEDSVAELNKLDGALQSLRVSIDDIMAHGDVAREGEHRDVLEAYRMFAYDRGWVKRLEEAIRNGLTAEAAVEKVQSDSRARMINLNNPYMRERLSDFDDLANRLLRQLMGITPETIAANLPKDAILIARTMGAAELLDYPRQHLRALVLEDGTPTSHVSIVARTLGIPVIGQAKGIVSLCENGDPIIVDGDDHKVYIRPQGDVAKAYGEKLRFKAKKQQLYRKLRHLPAYTKDGQHILLLTNAGLLVDLDQIKACGCEGVGLFRTELQFMIAARFPKVEEQETLYRAVLDQSGDLPVTFRTLDIGGDKILPYFRAKGKEENPALGWRAIRLTLDRPALMRTQLRALLKAAGGRQLRLMLPMVSEVGEIYQTRQFIAREMAHLKRFNYALPASIKLGAMIEVPALLFQLDELMQAVDFVSVGSNDLYQFSMAVDRANQQIEGRFDRLHVSFLRILRQIILAGDKHNTPVTLCGEMAAHPLSAMVLIGLGYRRLSMTPAAIGAVKAMVLNLNATNLQAMLLDLIDKPPQEDISAVMKKFALDHAIPL